MTQTLVKLKKKRNTGHDHSNKYINTPEFNELTLEIFVGRLAQNQQLKLILLIS